MNTFTQSLNMKALMESDDYVNNTDVIREVKHSELILADIGKICELKKTHHKMKIVEEEKFKYLCQTSCPFLHSSLRRILITVRVFARVMVMVWRRSVVLVCVFIL